MKQKILKRVLLFCIPATIFALTVFAKADGCSPSSMFWGKSSCTYTTTGENGATEVYTTTCAYRVWINWGCTTTYVGPM